MVPWEKTPDGARSVRIFGQEIEVNAKISSMGGFSAHAGQSDLVNWFDTLAGSRPKLALMHGEERSRVPLAEIIRKRYGINPLLPEYGHTITL